MKFNLLLYAVTDRTWEGPLTLEEQLEEAIKAGVTLVQLREKDLGYDDFIKSSKQIKAITDRYHIPLIINDNVEVALSIDADGVHIGQEDLEAGHVRKLLGPDKILGVTAKTVEQALQAQEQGADYLGSGAVFGSQTKLNTRPMSKETLQSITKAVSIPVVAIGGINQENIMELAGTGVAGAAVVSGIFASKDIEKTVKTLRHYAEKITDKTIDKITDKTTEKNYRKYTK